MRPTRLLLLGLLAASACRWGTRVERFPAATTPFGATMAITGPDRRLLDGELLAATDSGLLVARQARVTFVPYATIASARVVGLDQAYMLARGRAPDAERLTRLRRVSRFPQGLSDDVLARLLRAHAQDSVDRVQP
jgi:hypothetical protein